MTPVLAGFVSVTATLTTRCDLACSYCPQRRGEDRRMSVETIGEAARAVARSGYPEPRLALTGGEPLLEQGLVAEAASTLRGATRPGRAPSLALSTNGTALDAGAVRLLASADAEVTVSFDGIEEAQAFRTAGASRVVETALREAAAAEPCWFARRVGVRVTLHSGNVRHLAASVRFLAALGLRRIDVAPLVTPDAGWDRRAAEALDRQLAEIAATAPAAGAEAGASAFRPLADGVRRGPREGPMCGLGSPEALYLDVDGSVAPCGAMVPSLLGSPPPLVAEAVYALAGARMPDPALRDAMRVRAARAARLDFACDRARKRSPRGACASCEALDSCFACPASIAFAPDQDPGLVPAIQCDWNRLVTRHRRAFLARGAARRDDAQRAGRSSSAAETSAATPARIAGS